MRATICTNSISSRTGGQRWYSDRELRDDRTTFFNFYFPQGQHEYVYLLKVVNPGIFHVSPDQRRAHVSAGISFYQRRVNGDRAMTAKHSGVAKLWLLNLIGNALLLAAVYFWLLLPDAHGWQVAASGVLAIIVVFFGLWLRTGTFAYFRVAEFRDHATVWRAFRHALRHMIALAIVAIPFAALEWWLLSLRKYAPQFGVWFWQKAPAFLRLGSPRQVFHAADWLLWSSDLATDPGGVVAHRHDGCRRRIAACADGALPAGVEANRLLAVVLRADADRRLCAV